jgi:hypothetical protein
MRLKLAKRYVVG